MNGYLFESVESAIAVLAVLAGIIASLAFVTMVIMFWRQMPESGNPGETDWFETLPARAKHRA